MSTLTFYRLLTFLLAGIWLANGLFCKVLNLVPRHQEIIGSILGNDHAFLFAKLIGAAEILMAAWILSGIQKRINSIAQIAVIGTMNVLEFFLVPDLLLWGRANLIFALVLIATIFYHGFVLRKRAGL